MKIFKLSLLAVVALLFNACGRVQTADDIINKHLDAIGGREVLGKIKSLYEEAKTVRDGDTILSTFNFLVGKGSKTEININGQKTILCFTDSSEWMINPKTESITAHPISKNGNNSISDTVRDTAAFRMNSTAAQPLPKDKYNQNKERLQIGYPLINYAASGSKVELVGKETSDSGSVYKLKLTDRNNQETDFYIDANTYYLVKTVKNIANAGSVTTTFSNYQKTDIGYVMPFAQTISAPDGMNIKTTVTKVVVNQEIDPKIFEKPE
jgi:outer membrane lipoprotein-sorting protein